MTFLNDKKTFLAKLDKSKKGEIDHMVLRVLALVNMKDHYYTTSSCSGRVHLWNGSDKKNETEWIKVSHDLIDEDFFKIPATNGLVWLRVEPFILHVACNSISSAEKLLKRAQSVCKKSSILSLSKKIIVEIRGSEFIEMPLYDDKRLLFSGDSELLKDLVNDKLEKTYSKIKAFEKKLKRL